MLISSAQSPHYLEDKSLTCNTRRVGRWKLSWTCDASALGRRGWLISYAFFYLASKQICKDVLPQFHSFPSFLLSFFPSLLLVSSFLRCLFLTADNSSWRSIKFKRFLLSVFQWRGVIGKNRCLKILTFSFSFSAILGITILIYPAILHNNLGDEQIFFSFKI